MKAINKKFETIEQSPEIEPIKKAMKDIKSKRLYQRYKVIHLHLQGYTNRAISKLEGLCEHTVGVYVKNYKANGIDGLVMGHSPGTPRYLTPEQEKEIAEIVTTRTPDEVGFPSRKNWYINIVQELVKQKYGVKYSHRGMAEVLYRLNLSFTRPTYTLAKADPKKQEEFKEEFELLKKPS